MHSLFLPGVLRSASSKWIETRHLQGRIRGMRKQLTQIVQWQLTSSTGKIRKMARDYQKDKSVI